MTPLIILATSVEGAPYHTARTVFIE